MKRGMLLLLGVLLLGLPGIGSEVDEDDFLSVVTWNVANFPDGRVAHQTEALRFMAEEWNVAIFALQEVTHSDANQPLRETILPGLVAEGTFVFCASELGRGDKLAFVYDLDRVHLSCREIEEVALAGREMGNNRPALVADVNRPGEVGDGFDFTLINVHPRATDCPTSTVCSRDFSAEEIRREQFRALAETVWGRLRASDDWDLLLVGDYNELADTGLDEDGGRLDLLEIFFEFPRPSMATTVSGSGIIDHIAVSRIQGGAIEELKPGIEVLELSANTAFCASTGICSRGDFDEQLSDHFPVLARFKGMDGD